MKNALNLKYYFVMMLALISRFVRGHYKVLRNATLGCEGTGVQFPDKKRYEGVFYNVISITRGWGVGVQFPEKSVK